MIGHCLELDHATWSVKKGCICRKLSSIHYNETLVGEEDRTMENQERTSLEGAAKTKAVEFNLFMTRYGTILFTVVIGLLVMYLIFIR